LLATLRYHRDALAALRAYGNDGGERARRARTDFDAALAEIPAEVARLRTEAAGLADADATERADELFALAQDLEDFSPVGEPEPERPAPRGKRVRRG